MNTPSSSVPPGARDDFDTGPLSWVIGEIRDALNRSCNALNEALTQDEENRPTSLKQAKSFLHQAHGALQIVDVDGVAIITETVEDLLERVESGQLALDAASVATIGHACEALVEYLQELLAGLPHQPVRLFPYYRALLQVRSAERIHPADLFFPNLAIRPQLPPATETLAAADYIALRKRFESALLPFLKSADTEGGLAHAGTMRDIALRIEQAQGNQQSRAFWWVLHGFAESVAAGKVANEVYVKQLFARINLQIRRLGEGSSSITERLLRDALFFIARVQQPSPGVQQIRAAYQLDGVVPADYEKKRYGQIDAQALIAAKERLAQAKSMWNRIAGGDAAVAHGFEQEMNALAEAGGKLNAPALAKLLRELGGIARHAAHSRPGDSLSLEIATSLLFVENALQQIHHLSDDFAERADALSIRLLSVVSGEEPAESAAWLNDMSREAQQRQTMAALAGEMQTSLRQVEKLLDEYFREPTERACLADIDRVLHQVGGALAILDQHDAVRAVAHTRTAVQRFIDIEGEPTLEEFQQVAQNVGALGFFIESLQQNSDGVQKRFSFDEERGLFHARLIDRSGAADASMEVVIDSFPQALPEGSLTAPDRFPDLPTVEEELALHQQQSAELALSLAAEPTNPLLQEQLKESLAQVRMDARLVDNPEANDRARAVIDMLESPDFVPSPDAMADIALATAPQAAPTVEPVAPVAAPDTEAEVDAELLEIFLSEAVEVLENVAQTLPESHNEPYNQEHLTTLRRAFHTLKGSGRMVGLNAFGQAAWSIEEVLNLRLSDTRGGDPELYHLLEKAHAVMDAWVADLQATGRSARTPDALVAAAERVKAGEAFSYDEPVPVEPVAAEPASVEPAIVEPTVPEPVFAEPEELLLSDEELAMFGQAPAESPPQAASAEVIAFPSLDAPPKLDDNIKYIGALEISLPLYNIYLAETDQLVRLLAQDLAEWRHEPDRHVNIQAVHAAHSLAGSSATVGFKPLQQIAHALEMALQFLARQPIRLTPGEYDTLEYGVERIRTMLQMFALGEMPDHEREQVQILERLPAEIEARAQMPLAAEPAPAPEIAGGAAHHDVPAPAAEGPLVIEPLFIAAEPAAPAPAPFAEPVYVEAGAGGADGVDNVGDPTLQIKDELDADLLPVFIEEGRDMLPQMGKTLREWEQDLDEPALPQSLLRILHTIKGSARMAGAMQLGQHMHDMETRIENIMHAGRPTVLAIEDLLARHDHGLQLFEYLVDPAANPKPAVAHIEAPEHAAPAAIGATTVAPALFTGKSPLPASAAALPAAALVRVRADILDRLVNQAGEVSISRSRLETEVGTLRQSLDELGENVTRLRDQLREIEMQAESQITSHMGNSTEREFDPLEFDRFTRLQELTRMMAESVSDVGSVQQTLNRTVDSAATDLLSQARLTRELQQDLMRVRMVQFASISERLYRVTRQASKEVDKRVNLDIRGSAVEIDRSVLERMAGPFEHLLRNAIVHGIESRSRRQAAGKNETGELLVEVRQEGNEVVIHFSDDGGGLNLDGIRDKARATGLLGEDAALSDAEVTDLIFHPGFSTAEQVTELAGRGVGMDVVRSEATALGGRVAIMSEPGKGAHFTIHLPLTLAVTQVVVLTAGGNTYAIPSVLVEQVQQLKAQPLAAAYNEGAITWQGQGVPMHYLSTLLGDFNATPVAQQYSPLMIIKSGNERVAIHVDEILGNREVVVKNIGPQLSRMIGIAGATVLGSGEIVLILNPVPLAQRGALEHLRAPRLIHSDVPDEMGAVAELHTYEARGGDSGPVQGLRTQNIVMVVDDSLTVRRVTQRLLSREGYQVVLAKDGVDALEHLQSITPDVMLVDIEMPRMDGFDLTRNVRGDERTRGIPIIMITSRTASKHRNYAMELGVNEYLGKPYQEDALLKSIAGFVA